MRIAKNTAFAILSSAAAGLLATLNYAPYNLWWLSILALSQVFWNLNKCKWYIGLCCIYAFWACYFISGMFWVSSGMEIYSRVSAEKAVFITLFIGLLYALFLTAPWLIYSRTKPKSLNRLMLFPLIWVLGEWCRYWLFDGLTWLIQGYGHQSSWLAGWIPVFGSLGASFFSVLTAVLIVLTIQEANRKSLAISTSAVVIIWCAGGLLSSVDWTHDMGTNIPVTAVQPNRPVSYGSSQPAGTDQRSHTEERNIQQVEKIKRVSSEYWKPGLLIWPEGSIRLKPKDIYSFLDKTSEQATSSGTAFFAGGPFYPDDGNDNHSFNSIYGLGMANGTYHKVHRAPLGEYSPLNGQLGKIIPWLNSIEPPKGFGSAYQPPLSFTFKDQEFITAVSICYEIAFGKLIQQDASESNLLLNLSNDAWFNGTHELDQALQVAQIRALEHQKPLIRSTNSGLTAVIDYKGDIIKLAPREVAAVFESTIQPRSGETPYSRWGDAPVFILALMLAFTVNLRNYIGKK